jgi:UTP--glucose-1-phosphate uridylyltransferase
MSDVKKPVRKAVIAAAGFGTRFLPQTKAMPKEMMPLVDKPVIQYIVEELVEAGIEDIILVTGYHKRVIEDHFDYMSSDLRASLKRSGKNELLEKTMRISDLANFVYIRQKGPLGNATPLMNAAHLIGDEPFIYTFADDFFVARPSRFVQMVEMHAQHGGNILCCKRVEQDKEYDQYGIIDGREVEPGLVKATTIVEKPGKQAAPSDIASVSGYLLEPDIFRYLERAYHDHDAEAGEFTQQPIMQQMIDDGIDFFACEVQNGKYYDSGDKLGYLKTVVDFAVDDPDLGTAFREYLKGVVQ